MAVEGMAGLFAGVILLIILLAFAWFILLIYALIDVLKSRNDPTWKILWILVIALMPFIGVLLYYVIGKHQVVVTQRNDRAARRRKKQ